MSILSEISNQKISSFSIDEEGIGFILEGFGSVSIYNAWTYSGSNLDNICGKIMTSAVANEINIRFTLLDGSEILVLLSDESWNGPEAMEIRAEDGRIIIWS